MFGSSSCHLHSTLDCMICAAECHKQRIMIYTIKTRFNCKRVSSSEDLVESYSLISHCDLDLQDSIKIFLHGTLARSYASTKFGYKRLNCSQHIIQINIQLSLEPSL